MENEPVQKPYQPFKQEEPVAPVPSAQPSELQPPVQSNQQPAQEPQQPEKKKGFALPRINKEVIRAKQNLIIGAILAIIVLIILIVALPKIAALIRDRNPLGTPAPSAVTEPTPSPSPGPSQYADDEDVKAMESDIEVLSKDLTETVIREDKLRVPDLDFNVSFKK